MTFTGILTTYFKQQQAIVQTACMVGDRYRRWHLERCLLLCYGAQFSPANGPVDGGTPVTIRGRNFGSVTAIVSAKLASVECSVERRNDSL